MRAVAIALLGVLVLPGVAGADAGAAVGPVLTQTVVGESAVGLRAGVDGGTLGIAFERYWLPHGNRTRAEFAVRLPVWLSWRFRFMPQLGLVPIDYQTFENGQLDKLTAVNGTVGLNVRLTGRVWLVLEPLRAEWRIRRGEVAAQPGGKPTQVRDQDWSFGSWLALRVGI